MGIDIYTNGGYVVKCLTLVMPDGYMIRLHKLIHYGSTLPDPISISETNFIAIFCCFWIRLERCLFIIECSSTWSNWCIFKVHVHLTVLFKIETAVILSVKRNILTVSLEYITIDLVFLDLAMISEVALTSQLIHTHHQCLMQSNCSPHTLIEICNQMLRPHCWNIYSHNDLKIYSAFSFYGGLFRWMVRKEWR